MADRAEPDNRQGPQAKVPAEQARVFISYASPDTTVAGALVESLERHGIACWISPRDVKAGALYADAIVRAISGAKALVLVLSDNAIGSSHVGKEIERASSKKRPIIALRIDNAPLTPAFEYFLSESQWVEAQAENKESAYARLIDAIREPARTASGVIYQFGPYELDMATVELRAGGKTRNLEPQVFALLALLVENRERLVSKEEILEKLWDDRFVSDGAVASLVKAARQALGDDGKSQRFIRTIHRQGFQFVANVSASRGIAALSAGEAGNAIGFHGVAAASQHSDQGSRPSLAILPFRLVGDGGRYAALAVALPGELITELSRLRWLFVTARGSSFRLSASHTEFGDIGRLLRVRYCLWGTVEVSRRSVAIAVELVDTNDGGIVWADRFSGRIDDVHAMREDIRSRVLTALEIQIPIHEATLARHGAVENLDAWSAYHLGLQHMYHYSRVDNAAATALFRRAVALDPCFARAHAGLSFIHFQTAFMRYTDDIPGEIGRARRFAERGLELDPLEPFANFAMGRTYWLEGDLESSLAWLERTTTLSPHYAQGLYARAWTESMASRPQEGRLHVDLAMRLSPLDPLYFAMLATRGFTHMAMGEDAEAADWVERAARSPGAHVLIAMVAAAAHALNGDAARANYWAAKVRERNAAITRNDFCRAYPVKSDSVRVRVLEALAHLGF